MKNYLRIQKRKRKTEMDPAGNGGEKKRLLRRMVWAVLLLLTLFRLILFYKTPLYYLPGEYYDDGCLFSYAQQFASFGWLGAYNKMTLVKGISYPVFVAVLHVLHIPYSVGLFLLCATSALCFVWALAPKLSSFFVKVAIYLLLLYSPTGFMSLIAQRLYRMAVIPYAVLFLFSCLIGMYLRRETKHMAGWAVGAAVSFSFFYYVREDSVWAVPFVLTVTLVMLGNLLVRAKKKGYGLKKCLRQGVLIVLPWLFLGVTTLGICLINARQYGVFLTNDRMKGNFAEMMECISEIDDGQSHPWVWCSNESIAKAMEESPTLASVQEFILLAEEMWNAEDPGMEGDISGWMIRTGLDAAGLFADAQSLQEFCGQVTEELREAFADGRLQQDGNLHLGSTELPVEYFENGKYWEDFLQTCKGIFTYEGWIHVFSSAGTREGIWQMEQFCNSWTVYPEQAREDGLDGTVALEAMKVSKIGHGITGIFRWFSVPVSILAGVAFFYCTGMACLRKKGIDLYLVMLGFLLSAFVLIGCVVLSMSWFDREIEFMYMYMAGAYPLLSCAKYLALYQAVKLLWEKRKASARKLVV